MKRLLIPLLLLGSLIVPSVAHAQTAPPIGTPIGPADPAEQAIISAWMADPGIKALGVGAPGPATIISQTAIAGMKSDVVQVQAPVPGSMAGTAMFLFTFMNDKLMGLSFDVM